MFGKPSRTSALVAAGFTVTLGAMPLVVPVVSPQAAPQAVAAVEQAPPEHHCYKMIAFRGPIEVPCEVETYLTQGQKECLIGIGVAFIIDVASAGALVGPATAGALVACGVKVMASTP